MKNAKVLVAPIAIISLVAGIWTGLLRMGWTLPISQAAAHHGALMVGCFLGSVILVERIVAIKTYWLYIFPFLSAISIVPFHLGYREIAFLMITLGSVGLLISYIIIINRYKHYYFYIMLAGGMAWFAGNVFLLNGSMYARSTTWWIVFILFTVLGERMELSKFVPDTLLKKPLLWSIIIVIVIGLLIPFHYSGNVIFGIGLILIALWLLRYDIIRKSIKVKGLHRYTAILLGSGYVWLIAAGGLMMAGFSNAMNYDASIHAFFIGFTFSMIFAHGPMIFPGVTGLPIKPYNPLFYVWGALLQFALLFRILADWLLWMEIRQWTGILSGISILAFFITLFISVMQEKKKLMEIKKKVS